jgi:hypothetical protein
VSVKNVAQFCCSLFDVAINESSFRAVRSVAIFGLAAHTATVCFPTRKNLRAARAGFKLNT